MSEEMSDGNRLKAIHQELKTIRTLMSEALYAMRLAECEVPEMMRRFANYFHDVVHIKGEYVSLGLKAPEYIDREMERCADRFRHILEDLHDGGAFEKVRADMANRQGNRYDHTRQLTPPKGDSYEARTSNDVGRRIDENGTSIEGGEPGGGE